MHLTATPIAGVMIAETLPRQDHRGSFYRAFCDVDLAPLLHTRTICQINLSQTLAVGALRGLHFQYPPAAEMKMVRCLRGQVWDVALDLRRDSVTFLQWYGIELSPEQANMLVIPEGCAHGFQVLAPRQRTPLLTYRTLHAGTGGAVRYNDPAVSIPWPLPVADLSDRDAAHPLFISRF